MPRVRLAERRIWVGDESRELLSGEVHFWRLDRSVWRTVLSAVRELGLDIISTYVAWNAHELAPGSFDFHGETDPRLDLVGFLELAREMGFWVLIRPGPYIYAEWPNSGIPDRVVQWHRLHPAFLDEAKRWIAAVSEVLVPFQGAPIVMLQADNEADPWADVYRAAITDVRDARLRHAYATEIVRWATNAYRECGITLPIYANTYIGWGVQDWRAIGGACDLVGPDIYPTAALPTSRAEHRQVLEAVRYACCIAPMGFIPEFESGIWHGWHTRVGVLTATHYVFLGLTALQAGASGWNWYMLVNRDNWYMSPINELGLARPDLAPAFASVVSTFRELEPSRLDKLTSTAVTFDVRERATGCDEGALLEALYAADVDYEFFDLTSSACDKPLVLYAGAGSTSPVLQHYVESGGTLVLFHVLPLDSTDALDACKPDGVTTASDPQRVALTLGAERVELSSDAVLVYREVPGEPIVAERIAPRPPTQEGGSLHVQLPVGERITCGYIEQRGSGRLIVIGVVPTPGLLVALHRWLGVPIPSRFEASGLTSAVFRRDDELLAICTNVTDFDGATPLSVNVDGFTSEVLARVPPHSGTWLSIPRG